jgi:hypothetical protein
MIAELDFIGGVGFESDLLDRAHFSQVLQEYVKRVVADTLHGLGPRCECEKPDRPYFSAEKMVMRCRACGRFTKTLHELALERQA